MSTKARYCEVGDERGPCSPVQGRTLHFVYLSFLASPRRDRETERQRDRETERCLHGGRKIVLILPGITALHCYVVLGINQTMDVFIRNIIVVQDELDQTGPGFYKIIK